jgi:hypothetical protein
MGKTPSRETLHAMVQGNRRLAKAERRFNRENRKSDQRALKIKETADNRALKLERQTQTYKDERANNLRSQIESERSSYASKTDLDALWDKVEARLSGNSLNTWTRFLGIAGILAAIGVGLYLGIHG